MATDHDTLVAKVRAIMEHVRRDDACCADGDAVSAFFHYAPFNDANEETVARAYADLVDHDVLSLEAVEERETNLDGRRRNMPDF